MTTRHSRTLRVYAVLSVLYLVLVAVAARSDYQDELVHDYLGALVLPYPSTLLTLPTVLPLLGPGGILAEALTTDPDRQRALGQVIPPLAAAPLQVLLVGLLVAGSRVMALRVRASPASAGRQ